jgi:hypothetical protein
LSEAETWSEVGRHRKVNVRSIGKEETKLSLFIDGKILCVDNIKIKIIRVRVSQS